MGKYLCATLVILTAAATASAAPDISKPMGPLRFSVDATGVGTIFNSGGTPFLFDGYTVMSPDGKIDGAAVMGIFDNTIADMVNFPPSIGLTMAQALAWTEMSTTATNYSEVTMDVGATLPAAGSLSLGQAFYGPRSDFYLTYVDSSTGGSWADDILTPCTAVLTLDTGGPYVWDVTSDATMTVSAVAVWGEIVWQDAWSIYELPALTLAGDPTIDLVWADLAAAGATLGEYTLRYTAANTCTWASDSTTLTLVPEPATLSLLGMAAVALLRRRSR